MSAKEMFEKLGYEYHQYDSEEITCIKQDRQWRKIGTITICFDLINKELELGFKGEISGNLPVFIKYQELQAINKQVEELGWLRGKEVEDNESN